MQLKEKEGVYKQQNKEFSRSICVVMHISGSEGQRYLTADRREECDGSPDPDLSDCVTDASVLEPNSWVSAIGVWATVEYPTESAVRISWSA